MKKTNEFEGITLVALVITIIILLILAGITIGTLNGENGLIAKVNQAKKAQIEAEMKETLILAINELQLEKEGKATIDDITQEWADNNLTDYDPTITSDASISGKKMSMKKSGVTEKYIIDKNLNITEIEDNNSSIEFSYDVGERVENKVKILIHVQDKENGLSRIELPDGDEIIVEADKKEEKGIDYEVEIGKEYKIKVISENGQTKEETIFIKATLELVKNIAKIKLMDEANIQECRYEFTSSDTKLGLDLNNYTGTFEDNSKDVAIPWATENGKCYVHILVTDNDMNSQEMIFGPFEVSKTTDFELMRALREFGMSWDDFGGITVTKTRWL